MSKNSKSCALLKRMILLRSAKNDPLFALYLPSLINKKLASASQNLKFYNHCEKHTAAFKLLTGFT